MRSGQYVVLLCSLLTVAESAGQDRPTPDQPEVTSHQATATFTSRVNSVSVPVVVRDGKGSAVGDLRQEDFRLFDRGKQQVITQFAVQVNAPTIGNATGAARTLPASGGQSALPEADGALKPLLPSHYAAYVFDDLHSTFEDLSRVRTAADRQFQELSTATRAGIYTTSGRVMLDFTDNRQALHEALLRITPPTAAPPPGSDCPDIINAYLADQVLNRNDPAAWEAAHAELLMCLPPEAVTKGAIIAYSEHALAANHLNTAPAVNVLADVVRRLSAMPGDRVIILVSQGFLAFDDVRAPLAELMDRAVRSKVTINSLDARGLTTPFLGDAAKNNEGLNSIRMRYRRLEAEANQDVMAELAGDTGGRFFHNDNGLDEGLRQLAAVPEYVYVLSFSPQNLKFDGSYHNLKVEVTNSKGLHLQARRGYWAPNHAIDASEQAKEEIQEAVFSLDEIRDIPVDVTTEFFKTSDLAAQLTIESHLDINGLKFRAAGDRKDDTLTVVTGLFDQNGHYLKGTQRVINFRLRNETLEKLLGSGLTIPETFDLAPGRYVVRVVVRDSEGEAMAARNGTVNIP